MTVVVQVGSRYVAREVIGHGSFGTVFRGEGPDGPVAVKLLRPDLAHNPDVVNRFLRERSVLLKLRHPHLVGVRDLVAESGVLALVMDLVDGPDLRRYLAGRQVPPLVVAALGAGIARGLAHAHADGVVHRDLKPENVLIRETGSGPVPLVADFGVARLVTTVQAETHATGQLVLGTPAYLAPELARGEAATAASDVYALGVLLYEMAAGRPPFVADHPLAVVHQHVTETPTRPSGMPDALWLITAACLAKDPAQRPSAASLRASLATVTTGAGHAPVAVDPAPPRPEAPERPDAHATQVLPAGRHRPVVRAHTAVLPNLTSSHPPADEPAPARVGRSWLLRLAAYATVALVCLAAGYGVGAVTTEETPARHAATPQPSTSTSASPSLSPTARTTYASEMPFVQVENGQGPVELNRATGGGDPDDGPPLTLDDAVYDKGLGVHAPSRVRFYPGGRCTSFTARVGIDAIAAQAQGDSVTFQVVADDRVVYDSGIVRFSDPSRPIQADITGAQRVDLVVTDGGDGNGWDHADWVDPVFTCRP